jgi:hypothetical protein
MSCVASLILPAETALWPIIENDNDVPVRVEASSHETIVAAVAMMC